MRIINCTNAPITDSQFEEVKVSKYYRDRITAITQTISRELSETRRKLEIKRLQLLVKELDRQSCGKVCVSAFLAPDLQLAIAKAFLEEGYDIYRCNYKGEDVTWIDPR